MLSFEYFTASSPTASPGVFLPIDKLTGVTVTDLETDSYGINPERESKIALGILDRVNGSAILEGSVLGLSCAKSILTGISAEIFNQTYTFNSILMANYESNTLAPIPLPTVGTNTINIFTINDSFTATKLAASDLTPGAGILIPSAVLVRYGGLAHEVINTAADGRQWYAALLNYLAANLAVRSVEVASAVITATSSIASIFNPPAGTVYLTKELYIQKQPGGIFTPQHMLIF